MILVIVVVLFGATRLPMIGKGLGEGIKNFKDAMRSPAQLDTPRDPKSEDSSSES